jgi:hypothetical protein
MILSSFDCAFIFFVEKLHLKLKEEGCIKALMVMVKSGHDEVTAQVARGIANFAKCESRGTEDFTHYISNFASIFHD